MNAKVGYFEVLNYAQTHNVDFKTAAKKLGLSEQEAARLEEMNGGANWGRVADEVAFDPKKPAKPAYKEAAGKFLAEDSKKHPEKYEPQQYTLKSGRYVVYQKDKKTGKASYKYYAQNGTELKEAYFMKKEGMQGKEFVVEDGKMIARAKAKPEEPFFQFTDRNGKFSLAQTAKTVAKTVAAVAMAPLALLTSCAPGDENITQEVNITITQNSSLQQALDALLRGQEVTNSILQKILEREIANGMTLDELLKLIGGNTALLYKILDSLTENNQLLQDIRDDINTGNKDILAAIMEIKASVEVITDLIASLPDDIKNSLSGPLTEILNAIKSGNMSLDALNQKVESLAATLTQILDRVTVNGKTQEEIKAILEKIQSNQMGDSEKLLAMLELLNNINITTQNIDNKLQTIINQLNTMYANDKDVKAALDKLTKLVEQGNAKQDVTNAMLNSLYSLVEKLGAGAKDDVAAIIKAIANNGDKIDSTNELLAKISAQIDKYGTEGKELGNKILEYIAALGFDMNVKFSAILDAINKGAEGSDGIRALLEKVLEKQDSNTKAIIDAMANIKIDGGNIDLSSLEKMMAALLEQSKKNGDILASIDAKTDIINITIERAKDEILAKLDKNDANTKAIIAKLDAFMELSTGNTDAILRKMDTIINILNNIKDRTYDDTALMAKLDDILAAIKDHNVTVDITGKVTCECNCGGNHEGIIGDLDDILA